MLKALEKGCWSLGLALLAHWVVCTYSGVFGDSQEQLRDLEHMTQYRANIETLIIELLNRTAPQYTI